MKKDKLEKLSFVQIQTINKALKYTGVKKETTIQFWKEYNIIGDEE